MTNSRATTTTIQNIVISSDYTQSSATFTDVTGMTITLPSRTGKAFIIFSIIVRNAAAGVLQLFRIVDASSNKAGASVHEYSLADLDVCLTIPYSCELDGQVVKLQMKSDGTNLSTISGTSDRQSRISSLET